MGLYHAYGGLLVSAVIPIISGSHSSLVMPKSARKLSRKLKGEKEDQEGDEEEEEIDRLTRADAWLFPILGSIVLFSLFLALRYAKELVNRVLAGYFCIIGTVALARLLTACAKVSTKEERWNKLTKWKLILFKEKEDFGHLSFTWVHILGAILAVGTSAFQIFVMDHWSLSNMIALSLSYNAISILRLDSFFTGAATLGGLFLYDIWWVFGSGRIFGGTSVMESVARDFDAPIKIQFPKQLGSNTGFTLLGLGDIVLPGIFIALALRFDYSQALKKFPAAPPRPSSSFARPYFYSVFVAYVLGLITTIIVMHTFKAGQPALLYLSPACVGSVALCAWVRGEVRDLWAFDDGENDERRPESGVEPAKDTKHAEETPDIISSVGQCPRTEPSQVLGASATEKRKL